MLKLPYPIALGILSVYVVLLSSCVSTQQRQERAWIKEGGLTIMSYNVENLFDTQHDEGTEDFTYLPLKEKQSRPEIQDFCSKMRSSKYRAECFELNWDEATLTRKLRRLTDVLTQVGGGRGPDLVILAEVENMRVLEKWRNEHLKDKNYQSLVLIEGPDIRGIDVAMMSRFPVVGKPKLHTIPFQPQNDEDKKWMARSRGILESTFQLPDGTLLTAFAVHFPSQGNPSYWRKQAVDHLNHLKAQVPDTHLIVAGGDFNITTEEDHTSRLYKEQLAKHWGVSHYTGCRDCRGTHYYHPKRSWSFLDALLMDHRLVTDNHPSGWSVLPESIRIPNNSMYQINRFRSPAAFDPHRPVGVSDHWPIVMVLQKKSKSWPVK